MTGLLRSLWQLLPLVLGEKHWLASSAPTLALEWLGLELSFLDLTRYSRGVHSKILLPQCRGLSWWLATQRTAVHVMNRGETWHCNHDGWNLGKMGTNLQGGYYHITLVRPLSSSGFLVQLLSDFTVYKHPVQYLDVWKTYFTLA